MFNVIRSIFKVEDLRNRVLFTLLILVFFRAGTHIPIPGIDGSVGSTLALQKYSTFSL